MTDEPGTEMDGEHFGLGYVSDGPDGPVISIEHEISETLYREVVEALATVSALAPSFHYRLVERNFHDLDSLHQFMVTAFALGRGFGKPDRMDLWNSVMTATVNWLASVKIFLDHEATRLSRTHGNESPQMVVFHQSTSKAFDSNLGYRFATKFRDFVLHCGLPKATISLTVDETRPGRSLSRMVIHRDELLTKFNRWGRLVSVDVAAMAETFDPLPMFADAMDGVRAVQQTVLNIRLDQALISLSPLKQALDTIGDRAEGEQPSAFIYTIRDSQPRGISPTALPASLIRRLDHASTGTQTDREELFTELPAPRLPPVSLDPRRLRQEFHRDNRGVQALLTYLAQGGETQRFKEAMDEIIREDGGAGLLLAGLTNVGVTLAEIAAGALSATSEALVVALINVYTQTDPTL